VLRLIMMLDEAERKAEKALSKEAAQDMWQGQEKSEPQQLSEDMGKHEKTLMHMQRMFQKRFPCHVSLNL